MNLYTWNWELKTGNLVLGTRSLRRGTITPRRKSVHTLYVIPAQRGSLAAVWPIKTTECGIQGIEKDPGFRVFAWNDNGANGKKAKNMYALLPYSTRN